MTQEIQKNSDLVGKVFRKGEDSPMLYLVTAVDSEFPEVIHWENKDTGSDGCMLACFVRPNLVQ